MILDDLNEEQKKVVLSSGRPILVIAGAGSGKTKTIIHKALYLIQNSMVRAKRLLIVTFTNKAANEIKERIRKYDENLNIEWSGTFHSVASRIMRMYPAKFGLPRDFRVLDEEDSKRLFQGLLKEKNISKQEGQKLYNAVNQAIEGIRFLDEDNKFDKMVIELQEPFLNAMLDQGAVSFSYLMGALKRKLEEDASFREYFQSFFDYIIIDEFQDTNITQYEIIKNISKSDNICVIGDPNQCIYEWRMAHPDNIMSFIEDYNPEIIKLSTNYRSSKAILDLANDVLVHSKASWKDLVPILKANKTKEDIKPTLIAHDDETKEASWIAKKILELLKEVPPHEIAILVRASFVTDFIERALSKEKISYQVIGAIKFFQRKEIKDILSYIYFAINPKDVISFQRAITNPRRGIGEKTIERIVNLSKQKNIDLLQATKLVLGNKLFEEDSFLNTIQRLQSNINSNISYAVERLIKDLNYFEYLEQEYKEDYKERIENLKELIRFFESQEENTDIKDLLQELALMEDQDENFIKNSVKIMTIHKAKGLEFEAVFMPRLENGILPHRSAFEDLASMEEERRLLYVGITRAKKYLFLSYTSLGAVSDFVREFKKSLIQDLSSKPILPKEDFKPISYKSKKPNIKVNVKVGDKVHHDVFGEGEVINVERDIANVRFKDKERSILKEFLKVLPLVSKNLDKYT